MAGWLSIDTVFSDEAAWVEEEEWFLGISLDQPRQCDGFTLHVITMPEPKFSTEAHFIGIVYRDTEPREHQSVSPSTRYFTLEKAELSQLPKLCEWRRDESRVNYGDGPRPDTSTFADAVLARVLAQPTK